MQFRIRSLLLLTTAAAVFCGTFATGSIFWLLVTLVGFTAILTFCTIRVLRRRTRFAAFVIVFAVCGWVGLLLALNAPLPIVGEQLWQGIYWSMNDVGWFGYTAVVQMILAGIWQTLVIAVSLGCVSQLAYSLACKKTEQSDDDE